MIAWPAVLPLPQLAGFQIAPADQAARSAAATGPSMARMRFGHDVQQVPMVLVLKDWQLAAWHAYFVDILCCGAAWFSLTISGEGANALRACRVSGGYRKEMTAPGIWKVTASLIVDRPAVVAA